MTDLISTVGVLVLLYLIYRNFQSDDNTTESRAPGAKDLSGGSDPSRIRRFLKDKDLREESSDGEYRVVAIDSDGSVALGHSERGLLWEKSIRRPNQPSVSNDGTVTVESWTPVESGELGSDFYVFDEHGEELLRDRYEANALRSGVTADGELAWLTTAHADNEDGNQLYVYDNPSCALRRLIGKTSASTG